MAALYGEHMVGAGISLLRAVLFCDDASPGVAPAEPTAEIRTIVQKAGGEVLDTNGAGAVAGFDTAGQAIEAGLQLASELPYLAMGVSFGEVLVEGTDWIGSAVIEAARLQQQAAAGQVLVTALTADMATSDRAHFIGLGRHDLKGLTDSVEVFEAVTSAPWLPALCVALAVDMVESTQLLARVGDEESLRLRRLFEQIVLRACETHQGLLIDQRGDGVILDFPTVSAAADAGSDIMSEVHRAALRADTDTGFAVRAGLACEPAELASASADGLMAVAEAGQIVVDPRAHLFSRDRGIQFVHATAEYSLVERGQVALVLPRALRSDGGFVGRDSALRQMRDAWAVAMTGAMTVIEVTGDPGMGKTRLVAEFAANAAGDGAAVLFGGCDPELDIPYGPLRDALNYAAEIDPELGRILTNTEGFVPGALGATRVQPIESGGQEPGSDGADREQVFDTFAHAFAGLAASRPIVLVLDDLHWASASTLLVLRHIVAVVPTIRLMVVGTYRPMEIERGHPLNDLHAELLRTGSAPELVELNPLLASEVVELVETQMQGRADHMATELVGRVHRETSGSPFYAQELLRSLISDNALVTQDGIITTTAQVETLPIPDTVRGVVTGRLNQLDADVYRLLSLGAVAGPHFSLDVASIALDRPFGAVVDMAEAAEHVSLVTEGDLPRTYTFAHAIVRATLLDDLSATRLAAAHESIALALEQLPGDGTDALAHHWSQAAGPRAQAQALIYIERAAERDVAALAWEAAISRYRLILERLDASTSAPTAHVAKTWLGLGAAMRALGDAGYLDAMIEAGRCARKIGRADLLARAAVGSMKPGSWFANANETNDVIVGFCEDALDGLADDDPARVQVLAIMATSLAFESNRGRRVDLVHEAVRLARSLGDPKVLASALIAEHLALWDPTTLDRRQVIADELGQIARRRDLPEIEFLAGFFYASALLETCQVHETREQLQRLAPLIERTGNFWFYFLVERMRIGLDVAQDVPGTATAVDALFEESAASQADAGGTWAAQHGGLAIHAGRMGDMADSLRSAADGRRGQGIWSNALVIALLQRGDRDHAAELASQLMKPNLDFMWLVSMQMRAEVGYGLGDKEICRDAIEELLPFRDRLGVIASGTLTYGLVATSIGEAAIGAGDFDLAVDVLGQAVRDANRIEAPFLVQKNERLLAEAVEQQAAQH